MRREEPEVLLVAQEKDKLEQTLRDFERSLQKLKDCTYHEATQKQEYEKRVRAMAAELRGASLREQVRPLLSPTSSPVLMFMHSSMCKCSRSSCVYSLCIVHVHGQAIAKVSDTCEGSHLYQLYHSKSCRVWKAGVGV